MFQQFESDLDLWQIQAYVLQFWPITMDIARIHAISLD